MNQADGEESSVEPDVFLRFGAVDVIVECKLEGEQYADQWAKEFAAYDHELGHEEKPAWLFAIGGLPEPKEEQVSRLRQEAARLHRNAYAGGGELRALGASWDDIRQALKKVESDGAPSVSRFLIKDIREALELHGFRERTWLADLPSAVERSLPISNTSLELFARLVSPASEGRAPSEDWVEESAPFRPLSSKSLRVMEEICR